MTSRLDGKAETLPANGMLLRAVCIEQQSVLAKGCEVDVMGNKARLDEAFGRYPGQFNILFCAWFALPR
jgi:hypothetical protein